MSTYWFDPIHGTLMSYEYKNGCVELHIQSSNGRQIVRTTYGFFYESYGLGRPPKSVLN